MILAAAACAVAGAAGLSYIFDDDNDNEPSKNEKYDTVTVSSTITDRQGVVKCVIHPYSYVYPSFIKYEQYRSSIGFVDEYKLNQLKLPIEIDKHKTNCSTFTKDFSIVFFWSMPLKGHLLQASTKSCFRVENFNNYERKSIKFSIGIQSEQKESSNVRSQIVLSHIEDFDNTLDSLSICNPLKNNDVIPIGILKKKKSSISMNNNQKRFCCEKSFDSNQESLMRTIILKNVNLCVDNVSKILNQSCSSSEKGLITLHDSITSNTNKPNELMQQDIYKNIHSQFFNNETSLLSHEIPSNNRNTNTNINGQIFDGIILQRGKQFGKTLGKPMIRKNDESEKYSTVSSHSVNQLNTLLSTINCSLMREHNIETIEDLIRLFLEQGQEKFTYILTHIFQIDGFIVKQINSILIEWAKNLT